MGIEKVNNDMNNVAIIYSKISESNKINEIIKYGKIRKKIIHG